MDVAIRPGQLRHSVNILEINETQTDAGDTLESPNQVGTAFCQFMETTGREFFRAKQLNADMTHLLKMYWDSSLTTSHQLTSTDRGLTLNVEFIENVDQLNLTMLVGCKEQK